MIITIISTVIALLIFPLLAILATSALDGFAKQYLVDDLGMYSQVVIGGLGVIIHELGHMAMALLFHHRISHFKLLTVKNLSQSPSLGSVSHTWDTNSWYQDIGNFFIGTGPFYSCSLVLWAAHHYLGTSDYYTPMPASHSLTDNIVTVTKTGLADSLRLFNGGFVHDVIYLALIIMIASTGYSLSHADVRGTFQGLPYWAIGTVVLGIAGSLAPDVDIDYYSWNVILFTFTMAVQAVIYILVVIILLYFIHGIRTKQWGIEILRHHLYKPKHSTNPQHTFKK